MLLKAVGNLIYALNSNQKKSQVASGIAWGVLLGLIPAGNFFFIVLLLFSFFFNHNHGAKIFGLAIVKILTPFIVLLIDDLGWMILHVDALQPLFIKLYNMPFVPFTNFNNTLVMGGLAGGIALWLPVFLIFMGFISLYRHTLGPKIRSLKFVQAVLNSQLYKVIDKFIRR